MVAKRTHENVADIIDSSDGKTDNRSSTNVSKRKFSGSATYKVTFKNEWKESYPIKEVKNNKFKFHCIPCGKDLSCSHQSLKDVKDHCSKPSHLQAHSSLKKQSRLPPSFTGENSSRQQKVLNAEVMVSNFIVQHNLSISVADHRSQLFLKKFPDSQIAFFLCM